MSEPTTSARPESLSEALDRVYGALVSGIRGERNETPVASSTLAGSEPSVALQRLESIFGLHPFERDVLVLCAGAALEKRFLTACAAAHHDANAAWPTFGLALSVLDQPHWSAISRARPLRHWYLVELENGSPLHVPMRINERILQFLIEVPAVDHLLEPLVRPLGLRLAAESAHSHSNLAGAIEPGIRHWKAMGANSEPVLLISVHSSLRARAFLEMCRQTGLKPCAMHAADIPGMAAERDQFARLWLRESVLSGAALLIQTDDTENQHNLSALLRQIETPVAVEAQPGSQSERLEGLRIHLTELPAADRKKIWIQHLGGVAQQMNGCLDRIVDYFHFDEPGIQVSAFTARQEIAASEGEDAGRITWNICRQHARRSLEKLAQRLEPRGGWDDLVLPPQQTETLRQILAHVRCRATVNERWGFASRYGRGLGLSALFSGPSGTGKTMAADIIARELDLDLYRIDLATVVSKYIGETEKNLRAIFDAAEQSSAILLFDEADSLFGKRSEVRDSHDRYANLEVSYLLQRMEAYRGVAILTTNMQHALDPAFMRRIRFIVQFPFPDAAARARIWQRIFPSATPTGRLEFERLAQLNISGGVICNIAMNAAFLAAQSDEAVGMKHLLSASRTEYSKMGKPLTEAETRGWI